MKLSFQTDCSHPAARLACQELKDKFSLLCGALEPCQECICLTVSDSGNHDIDRYEIDADLAASRGRIAASNPRSLLFAAYRLLKELGFRWIRPGKDGEIVPPCPDKLPRIKLEDCGEYRFRGICIEGAVSRENVLEILRWMVKQGFNTYFIQFRDAYTFFARWYTHEENPLLPAKPFDGELAKQLTADIRNEVHALGLELQMVGHGWTCEPFGIRGEGWYQSEQEILPETRAMLAEVSGKRELWKGIALNTNLCYGQEKVRAKLVRAIADYAAENPDVDVIHFWLADAANNHCECPLCREKRPADWYVEILNEADRILTEKGLRARIVFLIYCDLLWHAEHARLKNPERFILMFAPITRSYSRPFSADENSEMNYALPAYVRNHIELPKSPAENLAFLRAWQKDFSGPGFDYDYHYMWDYFKDLGGMQIARVLYDDCRNLRALGLNGMVSCQNQRAFYPHGLGMAVLGETLWNSKKEFSGICSDYFCAAYGAGADSAKRYFEKCSVIFQPQALRGELEFEAFNKMLEHLPEYDSAVSEVMPALQKGLESGCAAQRMSWRELSLHIELCRLTAAFLQACRKGSHEAETAMQPLISWAQFHETELQNDFDAFEYITTLKERILPRILKAVGVN